MPIVTDERATTAKGFERNVKYDMKRGKTRKEAYAMAYNQADRSKKEMLEAKKIEEQKKHDAYLHRTADIIHETLKKATKPKG